MSSQIIKNSGHTAYGLKEYVVDTLQELNNLSIDDPQGSLATVINGGNLKYYMMNGNHEWKEVNLNSGSSGGGGGSQSANINTLIINAWYNESDSSDHFEYSINDSLTYAQAKQILLDAYNGALTIIEFKEKHKPGEALPIHRDVWSFNTEKDIMGHYGKYFVNEALGDLESEDLQYITLFINLDQFLYIGIRFVWDDDLQTIDVGYQEPMDVSEYSGLINPSLPYFRDKVEHEGVTFPFVYMGIWTNTSGSSFSIENDDILAAMTAGLSEYDNSPTHYYINDIKVYSVNNSSDPSQMIMTQIPVDVSYNGMWPVGSVEESLMNGNGRITISSSDTDSVKTVLLTGVVDFNPRNPIYIDY